MRQGRAGSAASRARLRPPARRTGKPLGSIVKCTLAACGNQPRPAIINTYRIPRKFLCKPRKEAAVLTTSRFHAGLLALCAGALTFSNAALALDPIKIGLLASS